MSNFNFYTAEKAYGELYLQFPKVLLYGEKYSKLSDSAKIAYMVFRDRLQYSLKNNWVDDENNVYFIYTNKELEKMLNKSNKTVIKIKEELERSGILLQKHMGFDPKVKENRPNRLYLADLEVLATDVYLLNKDSESLDKSGSVKSTLREEVTQSLGNSGSVKSTPRQKHEETLGNSGNVKIPLYLYQSSSTKDPKDIKDIPKTDLSDTDIINQSFNSEQKSSEQEIQLMDLYITENSLLDFYGKELVTNLKTYSFGEYKTFLTFCEKLEFSRVSVEKEYKISISLLDRYSDYMREYLNKTFLKCIQQSRTGKTINIAGYLFISFKNVFVEYAESKAN